MPVINNKKANADLRRGYRVRLEIGLVLALIMLLVLFNLHIKYKNRDNFKAPKQETVKIKRIRRTNIHQKPPPPPTPKVPVEVPNDAVINDKPIGLNSELNMNQRLRLPPPPEKSNNQDRKEQKQNVFVVVEKMPKLIGGLQALQQNIKYPELARKAGIEGTVYVQFIVNEKGVPTHLRVVRGLGAGLDQAAINAIRKARFTPGMQRGRPVPVRMSIPVRFKLQNQNK